MFREHYLASSSVIPCSSTDYIIMIENINKNLASSSVFVNEKEKCSVFTHQFKVPFKKCSDSDLLVSRLDYKTVLRAYSDVIIDALNKRMESCMDMLSRNIFNVILSDECRVVFKKSNGMLHSFNHASFERMKEAIDLVDGGKYDELLPAHYEQILKALYWVEKTSDCKNISFGNLISCLMELLMFKKDEFESDRRYSLPK